MKELFDKLNNFAVEYNHCFRPHTTDLLEKKWAVVYYDDDLKTVIYNGADAYSDIWFDDGAVAQLAVTKFREDLIKHFKKRNDEADIVKVKEDLKYYLNTNEENGVVYIPKYIIEKILKELSR